MAAPLHIPTIEEYAPTLTWRHENDSTLKEFPPVFEEVATNLTPEDFELFASNDTSESMLSKRPLVFVKYGDFWFQVEFEMF